ncbi:hypothetical protein ACFQ0D_13870, partial [Micromonospora zhanjiangensis]
MTTQEQEIARYVHRVRLALDDLPMALRDELVEDLPEHLAEVLAEGDGTLAERLGEPEAYAAELRTAAGIPAPSKARPRTDQRFLDGVAAVRTRLRRLDVKAGPVIGYARLSDFLTLLRPAWWVLRGYLVAQVLGMLTGSWSVLPRFGGSLLAGTAMLVLAVIGSIWLGRRPTVLPRWPRYALWAGTAVVVLIGLVQFVNLDDRSRLPDYAEISYGSPYEQIQDVYVYDAEGHLLQGVRLLDQNGQPIQLGNPWCDSRPDLDMSSRQRTYPLCPENAPFRFGAPSPAPSPTDSDSSDPTTSGSSDPGTVGSPAPSVTGSPVPA